ncbi:MAG: hypothetical protein OES46_08305 [Gammaproteobacteria bacterium]|jgi:hypothetical protein|nr:hypothetical protein [Gammaproteobacteria bacterium]
MMMSEMMKQCCGKEGMPDFEKMKQFMQSCGKKEFSEDEMAMMKQFCGQEAMPDVENMKQLMEKCGCHVS